MEILILALPLVLLAGMWFTMIRPLRIRQREATAAQMAVHTGSQIMTTAGIYGKVTWVEDQTIGLEISDGVVVKYARAAVANVLDDEG
ncbi:MAG: preprotein translocase subunit YajC [Candidatus Nanopelagicales bacterium]